MLRSAAAGVLTLGAVVLGVALAFSQQTNNSYAYGSVNFDTFIRDSYRENPSQSVQPFYRWLEAAYTRTPAAKLPQHPDLNLEQALLLRRRELSGLRGEARARLELETGAWLHRMIKTTIPKFSLERGFEFIHTVGLGERQCLLQSVLIAGLAQRMGIQAGTYMVWANDQGKVSNLGHVTAVFRLSDGRDVLVDASESRPFFEHQGLFGRVDGQYRFLQPQYAPDQTIRGYKVLRSGQTVGNETITPLSTRYLRSQFYFYRGERVPGGFMGNPRTPKGLEASAWYLEQAVRFDPENPLAVYVLGHVYQRMGQSAKAKTQFEQGHQLYQHYGFIPDGVKAAYASVGSP